MKRLQKINGDTVLEITEQREVKTRLSEKDLTRRKSYLEESIEHFGLELQKVNAQLAQIYEEAGTQ